MLLDFIMLGTDYARSKSELFLISLDPDGADRYIIWSGLNWTRIMLEPNKAWSGYKTALYLVV